MSRLEMILKAAELHRRGLSTGEIAAELHVSRSTAARYKSARPDLFEEYEPGSLEHRRSILLEALERGNLGERLRAVELLEKLGAGTGAKGPGRISVTLEGPKRCPACWHNLVSAATATVDREADA